MQKLTLSISDVNDDTICFSFFFLNQNSKCKLKSEITQFENTNIIFPVFHIYLIWEFCDCS